MQDIQAIRRSKEYKQWQRAVKQRDGNACRVCGVNLNLHTHHIKPLDTYPDFAIEPDNGITLCGNHHTALRGKEESTNLTTILTDEQTAEQLKRLNSKFGAYLLPKLDNPDERNKVALQLLGQLQIYPDSFDQFLPLIQHLLNRENGTDEGLAEQMVVEFLSNQSGRALQVVREYEKRRSAAQKKMYLEAWHQLLSEPDKLIVDRLVAKVKELYPHRNEPTEDSAKQFLSEHLKEVPVDAEARSEEEDIVPSKEQRQTASQGELWSDKSVSPDKSVSEVVFEAVQELTGGDTNVEFAPKDVYAHILKKYPDFNVDSARSQLMADCPNHSSYHHYSRKHSYYFWVRRATYRLL